MKTPHPHAALIIEWAQDTSRPRQWRCPDKGFANWLPCKEDDSEWNEVCEYRFAPEPIVVFYKALPEEGDSYMPKDKHDANLKLTFSTDGQHKLLTAEVLK